MKILKHSRTNERGKSNGSDPSVPLSESRHSELTKDELELLTGLRQEFRELFKELDVDRAVELDKKTKEMIAFIQSRIQEWADNRSSSIQVSLGMFAFSIAGLALISDPTRVPWYIYPAALPFLSGLLFTSIVQFIMISRQVSFRYPFIDAAKTWRWFYLYNVSGSMPFTVRMNKNERTRSRQLFLEGLIHYAKETIQLDPIAELMQDLEQLYLLLTYEGYVVRFAITTNTLLRKGIIISLVLSFIFGVAILFYKIVLARA